MRVCLLIVATAGLLAACQSEDAAAPPDEAVGAPPTPDPAVPDQAAGEAGAQQAAMEASLLLDEIGGAAEVGAEAEAAYLVYAAQDLLSRAPSSLGTAGPESVQTVDEAEQALTALAALRGPVRAEVVSTPPGQLVRIRPFGRPNHIAETTTDGVIELEIPKSYVFYAENPHTGEVEIRNGNCIRDCTVRFEFAAPEE